jgi:hypothetical protein
MERSTGNPGRGRAVAKRRGWGHAFALALSAAVGFRPGAAPAQEWRGRAFTRLEYVEARPLARDSVPVTATMGEGRRRLVGDTVVSCPAGSAHCFFYRPEPTQSTTPLVQDLDLSGWGFGVEGLRVYLSVRGRVAFGGEAFWPRADDHFDVLAAYAELDRGGYRLRVGRDARWSGLGFYGYDGASAFVRVLGGRVSLEAYGGWGLERGLPEPVTSRALASLEEFQPRDRNLLFGIQGSARPLPGASLAATYQREIETDRSGLASERTALDAEWTPAAHLRLRAYADYDLAVGRWGKARVAAGWNPWRRVYVEARVYRYRPVFSLQTIWAAFDPTPYGGWGVTLAVRPAPAFSVELDGERRDYGDTGADVPFHVTTDRTWRASARARWTPADRFEVAADYRLLFTFGAALSAGTARARAEPWPGWAIEIRGSAFQQLEEFRVGEGRVWSVGAEVERRSRAAALWASADRYRHDRRGAGAVDPDWTQLRAALGLALYLGREPGGGT